MLAKSQADRPRRKGRKGKKSGGGKGRNNRNARRRTNYALAQNLAHSVANVRGIPPLAWNPIRLRVIAVFDDTVCPTRFTHECTRIGPGERGEQLTLTVLPPRVLLNSNFTEQDEDYQGCRAADDYWGDFGVEEIVRGASTDYGASSASMDRFITKWFTSSPSMCNKSNHTIVRQNEVEQIQEAAKTTTELSSSSAGSTVVTEVVTKRQEVNSESEVSVVADNVSLPNEDVSESEPASKRVRRNKLKNKPKRYYKFNMAWLSTPTFKNWIEKSSFTSANHEYARCKVCDVRLIAHKTDLERHSKTPKHISKCKLINSTRKIEDITNQPLNWKVTRAELKLCGLLATNNLPFRLMDTLSPLCADLFSDSKIAKGVSMKRTKVTEMMKNGLGHVFSTDLFTILRKKGNFFSIIMDETTDCGTKKQCAFTVIFICPLRQMVTVRFFDIVEMGESGTAVELYKCLLHVMNKKGIPLTNIIGFSADTCNVMFGEYNSVYSLLRKDLPQIVCVKCSCHSIHLASSKACLKLPRSVEDLLRNIGSHFSRSHARQEKLSQFQSFFKTECHKILSPAATRWLSLKPCVDRVLEQFDALSAYFTETVFDDPSKTTETVLETLKNKFTIVYLEFMSYILGILNEFNKMFQGEKPLLHKLKPETESLLKKNLPSFKNKDVFTVNHTNPCNFIPIEQIYLGVAAASSMEEIKASYTNENNQDRDEIFELIQILEPDKAQNFIIKSLQPVVNQFPILKDLVDIQELDNEWREHAYLEHEKYNLLASDEAENYWTKVFTLKNTVGEGIDVPKS
ncbi:hypothetical protein NQ315_005683 [Exocentrus adspersus]|uniref:Uncharacterized protein n=1 Tax=Exocentrus adspersus TaxID=1586481 RepID=A0AAV8VJC0_9CUCU|nr:hypothetical protein NQ315_005683 [Exocentrus adspersus]